MTKNILNFSRVSVSVDLDVHPIFDKLSNRSIKQAESFPFETMKDLFVISACIGAKYGQFQEVNKPKEIFDGQLFNPNTEAPILASLAFYKTKNLDSLLDSKQIINTCEGWANGGIHIIENEILNKPGIPLYNFISFIWDELRLTKS